MGYPASPVVANFSMDALEQAPPPPPQTLQFLPNYVAIFLNWPHGKEQLLDFLNLMNGLDPNITLLWKFEQSRLSTLSLMC